MGLRVFIQGWDSLPWGNMLQTGWRTAAPSAVSPPAEKRESKLESSLAPFLQLISDCHLTTMIYSVVPDFLIHTNTLKFISSLGALSALINSLLDFRKLTKPYGILVYASFKQR